MGETTGVLLEPKRTAGGLKWLREHKDAALPVIHAAGGADGKWGCDADKHVAKVLGAFAAKDGRTISYRSVEAFRHENGMKSFECKPRKTSETTPGAAYDKMCEVTAPHDAKRNRENFDNFCTDLSAMLGKRRLTPDEIKAECERRRPWVEFVVGDTPVIAHLVSVKGHTFPRVCYNATSSEPTVIFDCDSQSCHTVVVFDTIEDAIDAFIAEVDKLLAVDPEKERAANAAALRSGFRDPEPPFIHQIELPPNGDPDVVTGTSTDYPIGTSTVTGPGYEQQESVVVIRNKRTGRVLKVVCAAGEMVVLDKDEVVVHEKPADYPEEEERLTTPEGWKEELFIGGPGAVAFVRMTELMERIATSLEQIAAHVCEE